MKIMRVRGGGKGRGRDKEKYTVEIYIYIITTYNQDASKLTLVHLYDNIVTVQWNWMCTVQLCNFSLDGTPSKSNCSA